MVKVFAHHEESDLKKFETIGTYFLSKFCSKVRFEEFSLMDPVTPDWKVKVEERITAWHESYHAMQNCGTGFGLFHAIESFRRDILTFISLVRFVRRKSTISIPLRLLSETFSSNDQTMLEEIITMYDLSNREIKALFHPCKAIELVHVLEGAAGLFDVLNERYFLLMNGLKPKQGDRLFDIAGIKDRLEDFPADYKNGFLYFLSKVKHKMKNIDPIQICNLFFLVVDLALHIPPRNARLVAQCIPTQRFIRLVDHTTETLDSAPIVPQEDFIPNLRTEKNGKIRVFDGYFDNIRILCDEVRWTQEGYERTKDGFFDIRKSKALEYADNLLATSGYFTLKQVNKSWSNFLEKFERSMKDLVTYPFLPWFKSCLRDRLENPQMFWGFSNIRNAVPYYAAPFIGTAETKTSISAHTEYADQVIRRPKQMERCALVEQEILKPVADQALISRYVRDLINNYTMICPFVGKQRMLRCGNENQTCQDGIAKKSKSGEECHFVQSFRHYFGKSPHKML